MSKLADLKKRLADADPAFVEEYQTADRDLAVVEQMIRARSKAKLTQAQVAKRVGTTQSAIARLETGAASPSIATLRKYAHATVTELHLEFRPKRPTKRHVASARISQAR